MEISGSAYAFVPTPDQIASSRVDKFMRSHGISDIDDLRQRSVEDPSWFWNAVVDDLGIEFSHPFESVFDDSGGIEATKWFVGGKLNVVDTCVTKHARTNPDALAVRWEGDDGSVREWTYGDLERQVNAVARTLLAHGVGPGDVAGVYMPMIPEIVAAIFGIVKIGAIFLPLFSGYGVEAVQTRLEDADAVALLTVDGFLRRGKTIDVISVAKEAVERVKTCRFVMAFARIDSKLPDNVIAWPVVTSEDERLDSVQVDAEHPMFVAYTSGTTGKPKGVVHVHGGFLVKIAEEVAYQTDVGPDDVLFWFTDMGWIMGPWEVVGGTANGATVALFEGAPDYPNVDRLWSFCERVGVAVLGASPTLIRSLMPAGENPVESHDLSQLRILASTGEPWNEDPWWWYFSVVGKGKCPIINLSGGTEVGACFLSPHPVESIAPMSLGGPALGMAVDVFDDNARPVRNQVGELVCRQSWPSMSRGLWHAPERFHETYFSRWADIWVHGDWASIDEKGRWFLHGRSDDTIKVAGKRIGPAEVESAAVSVEGVVEAAAIGYPDENKGEVLWVYVVTSGELSDDLRNQVAEAVAKGVGKSFKPSRVLFVSAIPKTRNGKVLRRAIRAVALGQEPGDMSSLEDHATLDAVGGQMTATERANDVLLGRRIMLRPLNTDDFDGWADVRNRCSEWLTQWEPRAIAGVPHAHSSRLAFAARCAARDRERESGTGYGFGIFFNGKFVGEINLNNIVRGACQNAYIGYWIDQDLAGRGIMPEAVVTIMQFAFESLGLHRVQVAIIPRNQASVRVAEKLKLRNEGLAQRYLEINGVWEDHHRFAMTVEEWIERRSELFSEWID